MNTLLQLCCFAARLIPGMQVVAQTNLRLEAAVGQVKRMDSSGHEVKQADL